MHMSFGYVLHAKSEETREPTHGCHCFSRTQIEKRNSFKEMID